ncbi:hypothetical protein IVB55_32945 [Bradyrhizobium sp. CW4]|uniref:nucleoside 2-deoxyribosyltransferase n=1 Tax=Bradyrhizobium sp. CW4 TaxID=2782687 RepID=UPI001FFAEB55|nr:nucleoside 2-deoxyribosyltransferase [Bradyrhizobium sp. CW4]MCK1417664.1 hypothetical protein [Bradyrhizobium sp. CW4]
MMGYASNCPLCGGTAGFEDGLSDRRSVDCSRCGHFEIPDTAEADLTALEDRLKEKIGFWTRDQNDLGECPVVNSTIANLVQKLPDKTVIERAERLLRYGIHIQKDLGASFRLNSSGVIGITHSRSEGDVLALAGLLRERGWLREITDPSGYHDPTGQVTPEGFIYESLAKPTESTSGFIAMWFDRSMIAARVEGFEPAIREAGYTPVIVSGVEHINKIDDEMISQIRKSKFLVADFTGHRGGVYFEAGFAMGLGLPVFWTCRQDDVPNLHFDIRQYNWIDWTDTANLKMRLKRRIEAILGVGPVSPTSPA